MEFIALCRHTKSDKLKPRTHSLDEQDRDGRVFGQPGGHDGACTPSREPGTENMQCQRLG